MTVFWDVKAYSLVEVYGATSQKTVVFTFAAVRT
jgi:hypothetical protein